MLILLTNDDGINAYGLRALYKAFSKAGHKVICVAPASQQSAISSAVSLRNPLRVENVSGEDFIGYAVSGTPVDCVKIALTTIMQEHGGWPDLVLSGMNAGRNIGVDTLYSGTVGAAMESARQGIPTLAISHVNYKPTSIDDFMPSALHASALTERIDWQQIPKQRVLNLNYPNIPISTIQGIRVCLTDTTPWADGYEKRYDPLQQPYWWLTGYIPDRQVSENTDYSYLKAGWVTLSVLSLDLNDTEVQQSLREQLGVDNKIYLEKPPSK